MAAPVIDDFGDIRHDVRGQAKKQAKTALREQNKNEWTCEITVMGCPNIASSMTFMVEGFGTYDGKYIAEQVAHSLDGGYTTKIKGHRVLEGY